MLCRCERLLVPFLSVLVFASFPYVKNIYQDVLFGFWWLLDMLCEMQEWGGVSILLTFTKFFLQRSPSHIIRARWQLLLYWV